MKKTKIAFFLLTLITLCTLAVSVFSLSELNVIKKSNQSLSAVCSELRGRLSDTSMKLGKLEDAVAAQGESLKAQGETSVSAEASVYVVREHNGIIGVFDKDGALIKSVNTAVIALSEEDQAKLKEGIIVCSSDELGKLLDDLS